MNSSAAVAAAAVAATAAEIRLNWDVRVAAAVAAALPQLDSMEDGYDLSFMSEANVICRNCYKLCMVHMYIRISEQLWSF